VSNIEIKCSEMNGSIGWAEGKARFGRDLKNSCKSSAHLMKLYRFASPSSLVCKLIHLVFPLFAPTLLASLERWVLQKISPPTEILPEYGSLALDTQHNAHLINAPRLIFYLHMGRGTRKAIMLTQSRMARRNKVTRNLNACIFTRRGNERYRDLSMIM